jgi:hypothetical protein
MKHAVPAQHLGRLRNEGFQKHTREEGSTQQDIGYKNRLLSPILGVGPMKHAVPAQHLGRLRNEGFQKHTREEGSTQQGIGYKNRLLSPILNPPQINEKDINA